MNLLSADVSPLKDVGYNALLVVGGPAIESTLARWADYSVSVSTLLLRSRLPGEEFTESL